MTYYVFIEDNKINGKGTCRCLNDDIQNIEVTKEVYDDLDRYMWDGNNIVINPNYEEEQAQKEAERVANLTMTALDFINFLQEKGLTLEQINAYLENNLQVKMQLTYCQNVYCAVASAIMPITVGDITITKEDVIQAFKNKNNENIEGNLEL